MTDFEESPDSSAVVSVEELDFSKYRTKELAGHIGNLCSLPKAVFQLVITVIACGAFGLAIIYAAMRIDQQSTLSTLLGSVYGLPAGIIFGIALWAVLLIHRSLSSLTANRGPASWCDD